MLFSYSILLGQFDNAGTSAANFLKIGVGGRAAAMGGAITGTGGAGGGAVGAPAAAEAAGHWLLLPGWLIAFHWELVGWLIAFGTG